MEGKLSTSTILKFCNVSKSFKSHEVLKNITFEINKSEIVSLVGNNGAGKTTLIKIMSGVYNQDEGIIYVKGNKVSKLTPEVAINMGIATVYQDLSLVDSLDVVSNIFLGREPIKNLFCIDRQRMAEESRRLINKLNLDIPSLDIEVSKLSGGQRQGIAIARAINQGGQILILDEPTAAMGVKESKKVFDLIRLLREQGYTIIIICHNIQDVLEISDRVIVLRNGKIVTDIKANDTEEEDVVQYITGTI